MPTEMAVVPARSRRRFVFDWKEILFKVAVPILAMLAAFIVGAVLLLLLHVNPITAYAAMIEGAFGSVYSITQSLVKATPLLLVGSRHLHRLSRQRDQRRWRRANHSRARWWQPGFRYNSAPGLAGC